MKKEEEKRFDWRDRTLSLTQLAQGLADLVGKLWHTHHISAIEAGEWQRYSMLRNQVYTRAADQGVDADVCVGPLLYHDSFTNAVQLMQDVREGKVDLNSFNVTW